MLNRIKSKLKEDKGNSVIILGLLLIMSLLLIGGLLLDLSKAYQLKSSYVDAARKATQAAIMEQTTEGYLRPEAAGEAVRVYEQVSRPAVVNKEGFFSKCVDYQDDDVVFTVTFVNEEGKELNMGTIKRSSVLSSDDAQSISSKMGALDNGKRAEIRENKYTSVKLELIEGTENVILPGAFSITQASKERADGMRCQKMEISAKANLFLGKDGQYE